MNWRPRDLKIYVLRGWSLVLAVVGNKIDLAEKEEVSYNEAKDYAEKAGAMFKLTSAKEGKGISVCS